MGRARKLNKCITAMGLIIFIGSSFSKSLNEIFFIDGRITKWIDK
jgi:hypothetical protein